LSRDYRRIAGHIGRALFLFCCAIAVPSLVSAWQWPIAEFELVRSFGTRLGEYVLPGVDLLAEPGSELHPVEEGEVVYRSGEYDGLRGLHAPLGSVVALEHERGFRSLYSYLSPQQVAALPLELSRADTLGPAGLGGFGEPGTLRLQVFDIERRGRVNPELLLPHYRAMRAPVIEAVALLVGDNPLMPEEATELEAGSYSVLVETYDTAYAAAGAARLSPYHVILESPDGDLQEVTLELERVAERRQWINARPASELVYAASRYAVGEVEVTDEAREYRVTVADHLGNLSSYAFTVPPAQRPDETGVQAQAAGGQE